MQTWFVVQTVPAEPQPLLPPSVFGARQAPFTQLWPIGQTVPAAPHWFVPPSVVGVRQTPFTQVWPKAQGRLASHTGQPVVPAAHETHWPLELQVCPIGHTAFGPH